MRKIISFALALCMCLSLAVMLTACGHEHTYQTEWSKDATHHWHACEGEDCTDVADKAEHTWNDGEITIAATAQADGVKTFTCTACGQTKTESVTVQTTVTEAEWKNLFVLSNCTVNGSYTEDGEEAVSITVADNKCIVMNIEHDLTTCTYIFCKDDVWYYGKVQDNMTGYFEAKGVTCIDFAVIFPGVSGIADKFNDFTYDSSQKSYVLNTTNKRIEVYVEDGKIAKLLYDEDPEDEAPTHTFVFSNYGTTVLTDFPEFCFDHTYDTEWSYNENGHWYQCTNEGCGAGQNSGNHFCDANNICEICGYEKS